MAIDPELIAAGQKAAPGFVGALGSLRYSRGPFIGRALQIPLFGVLAYYGCDWVAAKTGMPPGLSGLFLGLFGPVTIGKLHDTWERFDLTELVKSWVPFGRNQAPPPPPPPPGGPQP